jgi:hypothetical protein
VSSENAPGKTETWLTALGIAVAVIVNAIELGVIWLVLQTAAGRSDNLVVTGIVTLYLIVVSTHAMSALSLAEASLRQSQQFVELATAVSHQSSQVFRERQRESEADFKKQAIRDFITSGFRFCAWILTLYHLIPQIVP